MSGSSLPSESGGDGRAYPPRRHGRHTVYLRPIEAQKLHNALDSLMRTDEYDGADEDLQRVRDKLWAIEWQSDTEPREGVDV